MSDVLGTVATAVAAGGIANQVVQGNIDARVKAHLDSYTIAGTETTGSTITLGGLIPKGAKVLEINLDVSANQTSATFDVGDSADADRYATASASLQTAGRYTFYGDQYVIGTATGDNQIVLTTGGATLTAATLKCEVIYVMD